MAYRNDVPVNADGLKEAMSLINEAIPTKVSELTNDAEYIPSSGGSISGTLNLTKTQDASGIADNSPALRLGNIAGVHLEFDGNEIMAKTTATSTGQLYLNTDGGGIYINAGCDDRMLLQLGKIDVGTKNEEGTYIAGALKLNSNGGEVYVNNELVATQSFVNSKNSIAVSRTAFTGDLNATPTENFQIKSYLIPSTASLQALISHLPADYPSNTGVLIEYRTDANRIIQVLYPALQSGKWYIRSKQTSTLGWGEWHSSEENVPKLAYSEQIVANGSVTVQSRPSDNAMFVSVVYDDGKSVSATIPLGSNVFQGLPRTYPYIMLAGSDGSYRIDNDRNVDGWLTVEFKKVVT